MKAEGEIRKAKAGKRKNNFFGLPPSARFPTSMMDYDLFMGEALKEARRALARGEFPVGCVIVHQGRIVARGSRKGSHGDMGNELDHAEIVALRKLAAVSEKIDPSATVVFSTMEPCLMCFSALMLHGIGEIVYGYEDPMGGGATCDRSRLRPLYRDSRIRIRSGVRRADSLALFKAFFSDPRCSYWRASYLADYTLKQQT
jgi:tRNA(adenine34) deaminase